jgi:DNA-binding transcriptional MerR regulator
VDKDADAFRTISEVGEELDLPQHVLRFWETRFPQIRPVKRGGGRRYYRPDDCDLLRGIKHLLYGEGYTIKGVQRILKEEGVRTVQAVGRAGGGSQTFSSPSPSLSPSPSPSSSPSGAGPAITALKTPVLSSPVAAHSPQLSPPQISASSVSARREPVFTIDSRSQRAETEMRDDPHQGDVPALEPLRAHSERRPPRLDPAAPALPGFEPVAVAAPPRKAKPKQLALFAGMEEEGLSAKDREALRQVLEKIAECRKLIASADLMSGTEPNFAPMA